MLLVDMRLPMLWLRTETSQLEKGDCGWSPQEEGQHSCSLLLMSSETWLLGLLESGNQCKL